MTDSVQLIEALDSRVKRREQRRAFFKAAMGVAAVGTGALIVASAAEAQTAPTDADILNFALNLEYLEANFYAYATTGASVTAGLSSAFSAQYAGHAVPFSDPLVAQYAREIAADELAHVNFLRTQLAASAVAQPAIDVGVGPTNAFSAAARAAGLIGDANKDATGTPIKGANNPQTTVFDPYASDQNFLLAAFIFEDVGVTAYKGASPLISNKTYLEAAAGILAVEAYHASIIRTTLDRKGLSYTATTPTGAELPYTSPAGAAVTDPYSGKVVTLVGATEAISNARDSLDGTSDDDQGIRHTSGAFGDTSNIAPLDGNAIAFSRTAANVLNIVYLTPAQATMGGFFPAGVNGTIKQSNNNAS